jgi:hypothetical protein
MIISAFLGRVYRFIKWPMRLSLSFILGILCAWTIIDPWLDNGVPLGAYAPLIVISNEAFQINTSQTKFDKANETVTTWIRSDTGILETGTTVFTHMVVNCKDNTVAVDEQKLYGPFLKYVDTFKYKGIPGPPRGMATIAAIVTLCDDPNEAPPVQTPKSDSEEAPAQPQEDHQDHDPGIQDKRIPKGPSISV